MWWDMAPEQRAEFEHWHSHEHFPERVGISGFRRASRWAAIDGGPGFFVLYEVDGFEVLTSPGYLRRLNHPTPWSTKMMPHHRNMVRSQSRVLESFGSLLGAVLGTARLSPLPERAADLQAALRDRLRTLAEQPALIGGHLLRTDTPDIAQTREQMIRGGDQAADWIVLIAGNAADKVHGVVRDLPLAAAQPGPIVSLFRLAHAMTPADL